METSVVIENEEGLHARPAGIFVKKATEFQSQISVGFNGTFKNGKSIMSLMSLGLKKGAEVVIRAEGADASVAVDSLAALVRRKFQDQ